MNCIKSACGMLLAFGVMAASSAFAQTENPLKNRIGVQATLDYSSAYIWRGQVQSDEAVMQAGADVSIKGIGEGELALGWWGNLNLTDFGADPSNPTDNGNEDSFTEFDWRIAYAQPLPANSMIEIGAIYYYLPGGSFSSSDPDDNETVEAYARLDIGLVDTEAYDVSGVFSGYYDVDEVEGWYLSAGGLAEFMLTEKWSAAVMASVGWANGPYNDHYFGADEDTFNDFTVEASIGAPIDDHISLKFGLGYSSLIDGELSDSVEEGTEINSSNAWFKLGLHAAF